MTNLPQRIVIIGGGIAGLSTAWYLQRSRPDLEITIIEADSRLGGKLLTEHVQLPDSDTPLVVEAGPDAFISQKPWGLQLARELGLEDQLMSTQPARHKVYVLHRGKPVPLPDGVNLVVPTQFWSFVRSPLMSWRGKARMAWDLVLPARKTYADETLAEFITRRFGAEALTTLAEPLMSGIHNAESQRQSLQATFPRFHEIEHKYGSIIRGMRAARAATKTAANQVMSPFVGLRRGIEQLVQALVAKLTATIELNRRVVALQPSDEAYQVALDDGRTLTADAVVLAVPAFVAADLIAPWNTNIAERLQAIRYVSTGTVSLAFRRAESGLPLDSYGLVIPNTEYRLINAVTINSRKFAHRAPDEYVLLRAFVGGSRHPEVLQLNDARLIELVRDQLATMFGLTAEPVWSKVYRWNRANPQYDVGHFERMDELDAVLPAGLRLCGSGYRGVGIPDCVRQGQTTAAVISAYLPQSEILELER